MAKLALATITSGYASVDRLNSNFDAIEVALENTLSRDGTSPNAMEANLDMDSNRILNLPDPENDSEPVTLGYANDNLGGAAPAAAEASATEAEASATSAAASAASASASATAAQTAETNAETAEAAAEAAQAAAEAAVANMVDKTLLDAKGDIIAATAADTPARVAVGTDGLVLTADSGAAAGVSWAAPSFTTGDVKVTFKTAETGWVLMNDGTIGSASSGATSRANADTEDLYVLLWDNVGDQYAPVTGGRGASAAADFAANKALKLPKVLGRAIAAAGIGTVEESGVDADVDTTANTLAVDSNDAKWITGMEVEFTLASGTITGLTSGNTYYVIRNSSTTIKLASSLVNAQSAIAIDFTAKSSPVWTIEHSYTSRALGEALGEEKHAMSSTELLSHAHSTIGTAANVTASGGGTLVTQTSGLSISSSANGGNVAMNNMQPTTFLNLLIKL